MKGRNGRIIIDHSVAGESSHSKIERWRSGINATLIQSNFSRSQTESLTWSVEAHHFDIFICGRLRSTAQNLANLAFKYDDLNDHFILLIMVDGGLEGSAGRANFEIGPGDIMLFDVLQPMKMKLRESRQQGLADVLYVAIPRTLLASVADSAQLHGRIIPHGDLLSQLIASQISSLLQNSTTLNIDDISKVSRPVMDFIISAIHSAHDPRRPLEVDAQLHALTRICDFIQQNLLQPSLTPAFIGQRFALSRSALYRLFEPFGGIVSHIRQKRLVGATRMLLHPHYQHWKVAEIAYYWQFEPTTFSRLFQVAYAVTPQQARKQQLALWSLDSMNESQVIWLRSL